MQSQEPLQKIVGHLSISNSEIYYKKKPLKFIHTHLNSSHSLYALFNKLMLQLIHKCKKYRELSCIQRMLDNKWIINKYEEKGHNCC